MLIMISCRQASQLMSQQLDRPLKLSEKLRLQAHLLICKSCPKTLQQFEILHQAGRQYTQRNANTHDANIKLDPDAKHRILKKLYDEQDESDGDNL